MPRGRVRALDVTLDQDTVLVLFADDSWHRLSRMISDRGLGRLGSCPVEQFDGSITDANAEPVARFK